MTNGSKFKTAQERAEAFKKWFAPYANPAGMSNYPIIDGIFHWLELECEEEKPLPCPFCGEEVKLLKAENHRFLQCQNCNCTYTSGGAFSEVDAIAAHNRVAKAVRESDGNHANA